MVEFYTTVRVTGSRQASGPRRLPPEPTRGFARLPRVTGQTVAGQYTLADGWPPPRLPSLP